MHSLLWAYYDAAKGGKARCKDCKKEICAPGGTTSGLRKHLKQHQKNYKEFLEKQEEKEKEETKKALNMKRPADNQENQEKPLKQIKLDFGTQELVKAKQVAFDDSVVNFVAQTGVPFNVLGHESFKEMIQILNKQVEVKDPRTYSRKVETTANSVLADVSDIIAAVKTTIPSMGLTTDMWTSLAQVIITLILQMIAFNLCIKD